MNTDFLHSLLVEVGIQCFVPKPLEIVFSWIRIPDERCRPFIERQLWRLLCNNAEIDIEPQENRIQSDLSLVNRTTTLIKCSREYHLSCLGLSDDDAIYCVPAVISIIEAVAETRYEGTFVPALAKSKHLDLKTVHLYVKRALLIGVLVKDRSYYAGRKNKVTSKGIKIYASFYKPKHVFAPDSVMERECLRVLSSYFSESKEAEAPLAKILQEKNIPSSSSLFFQKCINSYTPEDGVYLKTVNDTLVVVFDSKKFDIQMKVQREPEEEEEEEKLNYNPYERVSHIRPFVVPLTGHLLHLMSSSSKTSFSLSDLSFMTGLHVKRIDRRLRYLESQKIVSSSIENRGRLFTKVYQLTHGVVKETPSMLSDPTRRTESTLQIKRKQMVLDALKENHVMLISEIHNLLMNHSTEFVVDHKTVLSVLNFLKEHNRIQLMEVQTNNPTSEDVSVMKKITVVADMPYAVDSPEVKAAITRYFDLQQEKMRLLKEDAQKASLRECNDPLEPLIVRLNAVTMVLINYFVKGEHSSEESMCLDLDSFLDGTPSQQLAAIYGFVDQEDVLLEPNVTPSLEVMQKWKQYLLDDLNMLRILQIIQVDNDQQYILSKRLRISVLSGVLFGIDLTNLTALNALFRAILASAINITNGDENFNIISLMATSEARALSPRLISDIKNSTKTHRLTILSPNFVVCCRALRNLYNRIAAKDAGAFDLSRILSTRNCVERIVLEEKTPRKRTRDESDTKNAPRKPKLVKSMWDALDSPDAPSLSNEEMDNILHSTNSLLLIIQSVVLYFLSLKRAPPPDHLLLDHDNAVYRLFCSPNNPNYKLIARFINTVSSKEGGTRLLPEVNMEDAHRIYSTLFSHHPLSLSVFKLSSPYQLSVIVDTLRPSLYPSFTIIPHYYNDYENPVQQQWNALLGNVSPLRVAFVTHTLLVLLHLYANKQTNNDTITILRKILALGSEQELRLSFYFIWNNYQLIGAAGKSISTFYLSEVPDYTVYRWLTSGSLSEIALIEQSERVLSHGIQKYSFQKDILTGNYLHLTSPRSDASGSEENRPPSMGLGSIIVILLLMITGQRQLNLSDDASSITVESTNKDESSWIVLKSINKIHTNHSASATLKEKVESIVQKKAILYSDLIQSVGDVPREDLHDALKYLVQQSIIYQFYSQFECFFVHHTDMSNWGANVEGIIVKPSSFLCMDGKIPIGTMKTAMTKRIVYSIVSNPGISLNRLAKLFNGVLTMEVMALCAEVCEPYRIECYQTKQKGEIGFDDDVFDDDDSPTLVSLPIYRLEPDVEYSFFPCDTSLHSLASLF